MIQFKDISDYCDLSDVEVDIIASGAKVPYMEACALAHEAEDNPVNSRKVLKIMQQQLEHIETNTYHFRTKVVQYRSKVVHVAINHFAATHKFT